MAKINQHINIIDTQNFQKELKHYIADLPDDTIESLFTRLFAAHLLSKTQRYRLLSMMVLGV